jgi:hypothetical protein
MPSTLKIGGYFYHWATPVPSTATLGLLLVGLQAGGSMPNSVQLSTAPFSTA